MSVRSAPALRQLYERYRTAPALKTSARKPGEWLVIEPDSDEARVFERALGVAPASDRAEAVVRELTALNGSLGVRHERDVRLVVQRGSTRGLKLEVRFLLVPHGKATKGSKPTPRVDLPAISGQLNLDQATQKVDTHAKKVDTHAKRSTDGGTPDEKPTESVSNVSDGTTMCLPDGTPLPDLSGMLMQHELVELWEDGNLGDDDTLDVLFGGYADLLAEVLDDEESVDLDSMADRFRAHAILASGTPPIETTEVDPRDTWERVSQQVVSWAKQTVTALRDADARGHMLVLAPSPGTGKSRGMMEAADQEQNARRAVGYAVLSRAQLEETEARLKRGPEVRLIVIEGRNDKNCHSFDQVTVATNAGFSPGRTVCPACGFYPQPGRKLSRFSRRDDVCPYYGARLDAVIDRKRADPNRGYLRQAPAIILTTHASAIQGSHIAARRNQGFWNFDTLFIDEDPTASMLVQHEIFDETLTYSRLDHKGNLDGPTRGSLLLRDAMKEALRLREVAAEHGFRDPTGEIPDPVHTREHGSTFAGSALHLLLESVARTQGLNLRAIGAMTIDGMTEGPPKGEIMNLSADEVATRYPNRYLAPLFATLDKEAVALAEARAAGLDFEPAYRVHLDLVPTEKGHRPVLRLHELKGYANGRTNLVIGDAYADVEHYKGLFDRADKVQVIKHRALWPTTSTLVRVVVRAGAKQLQNTTQLFDHLEVNVRPVLELERGRRIVFYVHKNMKGDLREWLDKHNDELDLSGYEIEHWGGGRGKDTYRDFDTFIGVTEYTPNIGGLIHEANAVASISPPPPQPDSSLGLPPAAPWHKRVEHWSPAAMLTKGSMGFANSLSKADPFFRAAFHRKATDELAQAVHRIRPAIPADDGRQKRAYVFGHQVPWSDELLAATAMTAVVDNGNEEADLETEALGRGTRFSITETLGLMSEREVAGAISEVFRGLGCWSHAFAHVLVGVPSWDTIEDLIVRGVSRVKTQRVKGTFLRELLSSEGVSPSPLCDRVVCPPQAWPTIARRVHDTSRVYSAGRARFLAELDPFTSQSRRHRPTWMPQGSHGYEFYGDRDRFEQVLASYAPDAQKVPF